MRGKLGTVVAILFGFFVAGYLLYTGVSDLLNTKDIYTVNVDECVEVLEIRHTINGLIPAGKDHYYLGVDDDNYSACLIKASKRWYKKNFNDRGDANDPGGLSITVLAKKVSDYDVSKELMSVVNRLGEVDFSVNPEYVLEIDYKKEAIEKLALIAMSVIIVIIAIRVSKSGTGLSNVMEKITAVILIAWLILMLKVIL